MKSPGNQVLAKKLARPYHASSADIYRKTATGWTVIHAGAPCYVADSSDRPPRPDGHDAGTDNVRTWNVSFILAEDVQMRDQLRNVITWDGQLIPTMTVATNFQTDTRSTHLVVCHAEDSAVAQEWMTFYREHDDGTTVPHGPYACTVDWEDISGRDPSNFAAGSHLTFVVLTGPETMDVKHLDFTGEIDGFRGGQVIEVRKPVGGRMEVRVQVDTGWRG